MITLKKKKNKDFVFLNLTDMHLMPCEWENDSDDVRHYKATVKELVEKVKPDLVTFSGDFCFAEEKKEPYEYHRDFIDSFDIPWAMTFGNHDVQEGDEFAREIIKVFKKSRNFLYEENQGSFGVANYVIGIEQDGRVIHSVLLMDIYDRIVVSIDENGQKAKNWNSYNPKQREWYENKISEIEKLGCKNSTLITHIPLRGFYKAYEAAFNQQIDPATVSLEDSYKENCWNDGYKNSYGVIHEPVCDYKYEDEMIESMNRLGNTKICLCGHDHLNNFCINYLGVDLVYSLKTGKSGLSDPLLNGGTSVTVDDSGKGVVKHEYTYPEKW